MKNPTGFLVYLGCPGCGKTEFCHSIINDLHAVKKNFVTRDEPWIETLFIAEANKVISQGWSVELEVERLAQSHLFLLDDMGSGKLSDWDKNILFTLIDIRYNSMKPTIITSNLKGSEIYEKLGHRIHSRIFDKSNMILSYGEIDWRLVDVDARP